LSLILLFNLLIRLFFPEHKIRALLADQIYQATGRPFEVDRISWSLLGALDLEGVRLGFTEAEGKPDAYLVQMERGRLRFRLLPLLKKQLQVSDILLDTPQIHLIPAVLASQDTLSGVSSNTPKSKVSEIDTSSFKKESLPISMGLSKFNLKDFRLRISFPDSIQLKEIELTGLNVNVQDLYVPTDILKNQDRLRGQVRVFTEDARLFIKATDLTAEWTPNFDIQAVWAKEARWRVRGGIHLLPRDNPADSLFMDLDIEGRGLGQETRMRHLAIGLGPWRPILMTGTVQIVDEEPIYDMQLGGDEVDLSAITAFLQRTLPSPFSDPLNDLELSGKMSLLNGQVHGKGLDVHAKILSRLDQARLAIPKQSISVGPVNYEFEIDGEWNPKGLKKAHILGSMEIEQVSAPLSDTSDVSVRDIRIFLDTNLDSLFYPAQGQIKVNVGNLYQSRMNLGLNWDAKDLPSLKDFRLDGELRLDSLFVENLPIPDLPVVGQVGAGLTIRATGMDSILIELTGNTSDGQMLTDFGRDNVPDYNWMAKIHAQVAEDFSELTVPSARFRIGELFSLDANARFLPETRQFQAEVTDAHFHNEKIQNYLPEQIHAELAHLRLGGEETFQGIVTGQLTDSIPMYKLSAEVGVSSGSMQDTLSGISVQDIEAEIKTSGDQDRIEGTGSIKVGEFILASQGPDPIRNGHIQFDWGVQNPDSLWIDAGQFLIDSLGVQSQFDATVHPSDSIPLISSRIRLGVSSHNWKNIVQGIQFKGGLNGEIQASNDLLDRNKILLEGHIAFDSLSINQGELIQIVDVQGRIPLRFHASLDGRLIPEAHYEPVSWIEYEERQDLIRTLWSGDKRLQIQSIKINDYAINHIRMDTDFSHGMIQIPSFQMEVFEGNIGGSLWFDPADGRLEMMRYGIRAQASRINSAALTENQKSKENTELNANLAFNGQGLDIEKGLDFDGYFHITQVGPKFASTLLKGMDPKGSDRSIRLTRRLLDMGWKPKLFSFELRHGHVYPSLSLSQPWFSPIRIPGRLEYGRIPFAFFLSNQLTAPQ